MGSASDAVADPGYGLDEWRVAELGPQPADGRSDGLAEWVGHLVPDAFEEFFGGHDHAWSGEKDLKEGELLGVERQRPAGSGDDPARRVEFQVPVGKCRGQRGAGASDERADAGDPLGEVAGLGKVVVRTDAESLDAVPDRPGGGQHETPAG